jgi:hypothetical protein
VQTPCGSAAPAGLDAQVPSEVDSAQLRQEPVQAELQQTPSTQKLDAQSDACLQAPPVVSGPQLLLTQATPGAQSPFVAQVVLHAPAEHA